MPFRGPATYLSTIDEFISHWEDVNAALAPGALVLNGPYDLAALQADRAALADEITQIVVDTNAWEIHRSERDIRKAALRERMRQLGAMIRGELADSIYVGLIPGVVIQSAGPGAWITTLDDYAYLWTTINASPPAGFTPPLTLTGGYALADFVSDANALKATLTAWVQADQDVDRRREARDARYRSIRRQLVRYRLAMAGRFPSGHALLESLPRLSPKRKPKPKPVIEPSPDPIEA